MVDLDWIVSEENILSDNAKLRLGDNYMLLLELLELSQSIKSFSKDNEVAHCFETQIINDFHLAALNMTRRHSSVANFLIRHAIESLILFTYSMEYKKEIDYKVIKDSIGIIEFDNEKLKKNANEHFERKFPVISKYLEGYKTIINTFYSHSNIYSSQYNTANIDERLKSLVFDNYVDDFIRNSLCILNDIIITTLKVYKNLQLEYQSFYFENGFSEAFEELCKRHDKNFLDFKNKKDESIQTEFPEVTRIQERLEKKYEKYKSS